MRILALAMALLCLVGATPGWADDAAAKKEARALFDDGNKAVDDGDYAKAVDLYRAAYARSPDPQMLLNLAEALRKLGRNAEAADAYDQYVADPGANSKKKKKVEKILVELNAQLGRLRIQVNEPGTKVIVDGKEVGPSPEAALFRVEPGSHTVVGEKVGFTTVTVTVPVKAGEEHLVELTMIAPVDPGILPDATPTDPVLEPQPDPDGSGADVAMLGGPDDSVDASVPPSGGAPVHVAPRRFAGYGRVDVDATTFDGAVLLAGGSVRVGGRVEVTGAAILGGNFGAYLGASVVLRPGTWRPILVAGVPVYFSDGVWPALHGAAGIEADVSARLGVFVLAGMEYFPSVPADNFVQTVFVPSLGVQARL